MPTHMEKKFFNISTSPGVIAKALGEETLTK